MPSVLVPWTPMSRATGDLLRFAASRLKNGRRFVFCPTFCSIICARRSFSSPVTMSVTIWSIPHVLGAVLTLTAINCAARRRALSSASAFFITVINLILQDENYLNGRFVGAPGIHDRDSRIAAYPLPLVPRSTITSIIAGFPELNASLSVSAISPGCSTRAPNPP
jgi:hypothetical protein